MRAEGAAGFFDDYVSVEFPRRRRAAGADWQWPGDEWVSESIRERTYSLITDACSGRPLSDVIEIGPGSGKYTEMLLDRTEARVMAFEISAGFVASLEARCSTHRDSGRLAVHHLASPDNRSLLQAHGRPASVDLVFGIDVFLMMDVQSLLVYLISAASLLKPGGVLYGTFGDATSDSGWTRMLRDASRHSAFDQSPSTRFHWVNEALLATMLTRLGFAPPRIVRGPTDGLDIARLYVSAEMVTPLPLARALELLTPAGDSTNRADG